MPLEHCTLPLIAGHRHVAFEHRSKSKTEPRSLRSTWR